MKLTRLRMFEKRVREDGRIAQYSNDISVYHRFDGKWFTEADVTSDDSVLVSNLSHTLRIQHAWRQRKSRITFFPVSDLDAVVVIAFSSPPKKVTRDRASDYMKECLEQATHEYNATHNEMTGLLNKAAFNSVLAERLVSPTENAEMGALGAEQNTAATNISLLAIDIDHFKQINDTHGHNYGDLVLKCLAMRLESCAADIAESFEGRVTIRCGHPSGEEFLILLAGWLTQEEEMKIAEAFRSAISNNTLPTDREWDALSQDILPQDSRLPHPSERRVTVSIGVAHLPPKFDPDATDRFGALLTNNADIALYRAKSAGRNRSIHFDNVLTHHGSLIEHHTDANVVVIDIGRRVNVRLGNEFRVYHPDFTGTKPYVQHDGRTERILGAYPRISTGRIEVFDVQEEISFARVIENDGNTVFASRSLLELVPAGTITHLVSVGPAPVGMQAIRDACQRAGEQDQHYLVCIFTLADVEGLLESGGTAYVNRLLAEFYQKINAEPATLPLIAQVDRFQFVVFLREEDELLEKLQTLLKRHGDNHRGEARFLAGACQSQLFGEHTLQCAQYAIAEAQAENSFQIVVFSDNIAKRILTRSGRLNRVDQARIDYQNFCKFGIEYGRLDNDMSIIEYRAGNPNEALRLVELAIQRSPEYEVYYANRAFLLFETGDRMAAYDAVVDYEKLALSGVDLPDSHYARAALAYLAKWKSDPQGINFTNWARYLDIGLKSKDSSLEPLQEELSEAAVVVHGES